MFNKWLFSFLHMPFISLLTNQNCQVNDIDREWLVSDFLSHQVQVPIWNRRLIYIEWIFTSTNVLLDRWKCVVLHLRLTTNKTENHQIYPFSAITKEKEMWVTFNDPTLKPLTPFLGQFQYKMLHISISGALFAVFFFTNACIHRQLQANNVYWRTVWIKKSSRILLLL